MKPTKPEVTILAGAGLSRGSGLPLGDELAEKALNLVLISGQVLLNDSELLSVRRAAKRLRLEILLERLVTEAPKYFLFGVYDLLKGARPNFNHLAVITLKPHSLVTTNQDLLLEEAAESLSVKRSVIHLHGRCDNRQSIITTISQYLSGLRPTVEDQFRASLTGKHVVVLGYSGRDRDIMPLLSEGTMRSVTWLHHPGGQMSPELLQLKEQLGGRVRIIVEDANLWLRRQLTKSQNSYLDAVERKLASSHRPRPIIGVAKRKKLSLLETTLALGRVIEHLGQYEIAFNLYGRLLRRVRHPATSLEVETRVRLAIARVQTFRYRFRSACRGFTRIASNFKAPAEQRCEALAGCVFALRNSSSYRAAQKALEELETLLSVSPKSAPFMRCRGEAAAARAGMLRLAGEAFESTELYLKADKFFRRAHDVDGWIDISTWLSDNLLTLGRFREADAYLRRAIDDANAYGRHFSNEWAEFLRGELLGMGGDVASGLEVIEEAYRIFRRMRNPQGQVYSLLYIADFSRDESPAEAGRALRHAEKLLQEHNFAYAFGRFLLETAELARARGRSSEVSKHLTSLALHLGQHRRFNISPHLLLAHAQCVAAELARDINSPAALAQLQAARDTYSKLGAAHCVTRIDVATWLLGCSSLSRRELITICANEGYGHELKWLRRRSSEYYPLHFV
jgi:tetratricopeptide (TPR) repeat protein